MEKELHGTWRIIPSAPMTEIVAQSGFNFQILDCEHGAYDFQTLEHDIRSCNLHNCAAYVRVSGIKNQAEIQRCLDLGAHGIVFPALKTYEEFEQATLLVQYAPSGSRGFNPFVRSWGYGFIDGNIIKPLCIPIIETLQAVHDIDKILTLPGIDMVYIGSYDLSAQLGCMGKMDDPQLIELIQSIINKCNSASIPVGLMIDGSEKYNAYKNKGVNWFVHTVDSDQLKKTFSNAISQLNK